MATELKESVLEELLRQLPGLLGLHLVGCGKLEHATVLRLISHTPLLESLSMTTTVSVSLSSQYQINRIHTGIHYSFD